MKRIAAVTAIVLAVLAVPVFFIVLRYRNDGARTPEDCLKDAIFGVQRVSRRIAEAEEYEEILKTGEALRTEAARLRDLQAEFAAMPEPSRWERSRMRKHRQLAESTLEAWGELEKDFRARIDEGLPPHVRQQLTHALDDFAAARAESWGAMTANWD
jgi:hypothetical protein